MYTIELSVFLMSGGGGSHSEGPLFRLDTSLLNLINSILSFCIKDCHTLTLN